MKIKSLLLASLGLVFTVSTLAVHGQGYVLDALRIAKPSIGGTTRSISIGGAQASLGGDIGTLNSNPAGLGFYRRSDFAITGQYHSNALESTYLGNKTTNSPLESYSLANAGIVFAQSSALADKGKATENKLIAFAFGAGYSRLNSLDLTTSFGGRNTGANFTSNLAELGSRYGISQSTFASSVAGIAYDEYLINPTDKTNTAFNGLSGGGAGAGVIQQGTYFEKGYTDQSNLSLGANFGNVVYLGAGVNFENYNYSRYTDFIETGLKDPNKYVDGLQYNRSSIQTGTGINGKLGIIFNLLNVIHLGGYVQTPTNFTMSESLAFSLVGLKNGQTVLPSVNYTNSKGVVTAGTYDPTVQGYNEYSIKTPYRYNVGASLILGDFGFLSADAEYINYKELNFNSNSSAFDQSINSTIRASYTDVINYRAGAELKFGPLVLRGGYVYYPSYLTNPATVADERIISGGFGIHTGHFYIDFGGLRDYSRNYRPAYTFADGSGPVVKQYNIRTSGTITIGTRF